MILDILAFGAHPDDVELAAGATLAKQVFLGNSIGIVDLTRGELGTRGTPEIRDLEAIDAAKILGASARENLCFKDGFFQIDEFHQRKIIEVIRKYRPKLVLANAPNDRHPNHGRAAKLVVEACFLAGLRQIETRIDGQLQDPWRPSNVLHYIQFYDLKPDFIFDVTGFWNTKMQAVLAHKSQFYNPNSNEPPTVISSKGFLDSLSNRASELGRLIGTEHGEGFIKTRDFGVNNLLDLI
ncbi:MAG: bacillithiol biosynthesis deacetylase BshB1 [Bacteroidia bacterium]|nr:bacillithiol biosynthesis deacetylase BshB1 [Bacteroidia bacterium]